MSAAVTLGTVAAPSVGDIEIAARTSGWPRLAWGGQVLEGERAWREVLTAVRNAPAARTALWSALGATAETPVRRVRPGDPHEIARAAAPASGSLARHRTVPPSPQELGIFDAAVQHARRCGVAFAPKAVDVYWTRDDLGRRDGVPFAGLTYHRRVRPVQIYLASGLRTRLLLGVVLHELSHAADGLAFGDMTDAEHEARAEIFTAQALALFDRMSRGEVPTVPVRLWP